MCLSGTKPTNFLREYPVFRKELLTPTGSHARFTIIQRHTFVDRPRIKFRFNRTLIHAPFKGGDPAAASATATLLRLSPSHQPRRGHP